ncbi:MAG: hypothetical protein PF517_05710 [Salinivirgaceae bacterium]|jgi:hypothetical protein|nr:hypothetical protein [Salinivirgaceae bacterium]
MKINPIILFFAIIIITACHQQNAEKSIIKETASSKVKVCKMFQSDFVLLNPNEEGHLIQEFRFNKKGFVNELIRYGMDGEIIGRFDILGEHTPFPMPGKPEFVDTVLTVVNFDEGGNIKGKEIKMYNTLGLLIQVEFYEGDSNLVNKNTYTYDKQNMILEDIYWDVDLDKPKQKIRYKFEYFMN